MKKFVNIFPGNAIAGHNRTRPFIRACIDNPNPQKAVLYNYQIDIVDNCNDSLLSLSVAPTGSGKSLTMITIAAKNYSVGLSTFILVPKIAIADGFNHTDNGKFTIKCKRKSYTLHASEIERIDCADRSSVIKKRLEQSVVMPVVVVSCYESFAIAYRSLRGLIDCAKIQVLVDEAHHVSGDINGLGKLVESLIKDGVPVHKFTATAYRADGTETVAPEMKKLVGDGFRSYRRTLIDHYNEGYCPDLNIHFRFFDDVAAADHKDVTGLDGIDIHSPEKLIKAYVDEFKKNRKRHTLMILPCVIKKDGRKISAAKVACDLERALLKKFGDLNIINLGGKDNALISNNGPEYRKRRKKLCDSKKDGSIDVVISLRIMDEGVDWPDCSDVYMARVPGSLPLIIQRIGRAMRMKKNSANIYFFELGIKEADKQITCAMVNIACRLQCLFHGLEFREPFSFVGNRRLQTKLKDASSKSLNDANVNLAKLAVELDGTKDIKTIVKAVKSEYKKHGMILSDEEALEVAVSTQLLKTSKKNLGELQRLRKLSTSSEFKDFCNQEGVKKILDNMVIQSPREFLELLSECSSKELVRYINEFKSPMIIRKTELLKMAENGEDKPNTNNYLYETFCYTRPSHNCFDPVFAEELRKIRPDWFEKSSDKNKAELMKMAKSGEDRPNIHNHLYGMLIAYTRPSCNCFDPAFAEELRKIRPEWFQRKNQKNENMAKLLEIAKNGEKKPGTKHRLYSNLKNYLIIDPVFAEELRKIRPDWFEKSSDKNKAELMKMAKSGEDKPSHSNRLYGVLKIYTSEVNVCFDHVFTEQLRKIRPDWLKKRSTSHDDNKTELLKRAKAGKNKPRPKINMYLYRKLMSYTNNGLFFDLIFTKKLRKIAPSWLK